METKSVTAAPTAVDSWRFLFAAKRAMRAFSFVSMPSSVSALTLAALALTAAGGMLLLLMSSTVLISVAPLETVPEALLAAVAVGSSTATLLTVTPWLGVALRLGEEGGRPSAPVVATTSRRTLRRRRGSSRRHWYIDDKST